MIVRLELSRIARDIYTGAEPLSVAFGMLVRAYQYAQDTNVDRWDFAIPISEFRYAGVTISELRWLLFSGFKMNGMPDFSSHLYGGPQLNTVFIRLKGAYGKDFKRASQFAGFLRARTTSPHKDYTWHHHEIMGIMQLVERRAHSPFFKGVQHYGGNFFWLIAGNVSFYK